MKTLLFLLFLFGIALVLFFAQFYRPIGLRRRKRILGLPKPLDSITHWEEPKSEPRIIVEGRVD